MRSIHRPIGFLAVLGGVGIVLLGPMVATKVPGRRAEAGWLWNRKSQAHACGHAGCCTPAAPVPADWGGTWLWVRSPDQEQRVVMSLYNRYCIRCHGVDGRGVWDIPDVPDFTDPRWQVSRPDAQIVNILIEGRGAVMPAFRGTLSLDEAWAMAHYLRTFVPGTELSRPDVGRSRPNNTQPSTAPNAPPTPSVAPRQ